MIHDPFSRLVAGIFSSGWGAEWHVLDMHPVLGRGSLPSLPNLVVALHLIKRQLTLSSSVTMERVRSTWAAVSAAKSQQTNGMGPSV